MIFRGVQAGGKQGESASAPVQARVLKKSRFFLNAALKKKAERGGKHARDFERAEKRQ
jgi:hypothetical protein